MARYRKVDPRIWNDAKFSDLSDNGKLVFFMLLTHPSMTALGAMRATIPGMAAELGWGVEAFREAFEEASSKGMAEHDEKACFVSLPSFLKYNPPESPNVVKAWVGSMDLLPECQLKTQALQRAGAFAEGMTEGFAKAFTQAFGKAMPIQEQEQEQEQRKKPSRSPAGSRLPADWTLPVEWRLWAAEERRDVNPELEADKFRDYWHAQPGAKARKADWPATWRNWIRNARVNANVVALSTQPGGGRRAL